MTLKSREKWLTIFSRLFYCFLFIPAALEMVRMLRTAVISRGGKTEWWGRFMKMVKRSREISRSPAACTTWAWDFSTPLRRGQNDSRAGASLWLGEIPDPFFDFSMDSPCLTWFCKKSPPSLDGEMNCRFFWGLDAIRKTMSSQVDLQYNQ